MAMSSQPDLSAFYKQSRENKRQVFDNFLINLTHNSIVALTATSLVSLIFYRRIRWIVPVGCGIASSVAVNELAFEFNRVH